MMRSITIAAFTLALAAGSVQAQQQQQPPSGGEHGGRHGQQRDEMRQRRQRGAESNRGLFRGITLTDAQKTRVDAIDAKYRPQFDSLRTQARAERDSAGPSTQTRARMRQLMQARQQEVRGVLTADQQKTFDANVKEMRERMAERGQGQRPRGPRARGPHAHGRS